MPRKLALIVCLLIWGTVRASIFDGDLGQLVSRADLDYDTPARRSEEGMPIGNGRMGSLVWTTPTSAHLSDQSR